MFVPDRTRGLAMKPVRDAGPDFILNEDMMTFYGKCLEEMSKVYTDELHEVSPEEVIVRLVQEFGWIAVQDDYGTKAYKGIPYPYQNGTGEYRITVVLKKSDQVLHVDTRVWVPRNTQTFSSRQ